MSEREQHFYISISDESFEVMFTTYYQMLYSYAVTIIRDSEAAKDIVQEVFLKIWHNREKIVINASLRGFLLRATHNQCIDSVRAGKYLARGITAEDVARRTEILGLESEEGIFDKIYSDQLQDRLTEVVDTLPTRCRQIFLLNREEGLSYLQIASVLGLSHSTVKNQMMIAMRKLHEALRELL